MFEGKNFQWSLEKNEQLKSERGLSFETVARAINEGKVLLVIQHPNQTKYPSQQVIIIEIHDYVYAVPFIQTEQGVFLKTIFPSRKLKKKYLGE